MPRAGNCLPQLDSVVAGAVGAKLYLNSHGFFYYRHRFQNMLVSSFPIYQTDNLEKMSPFAIEKRLAGIDGSLKSVKNLLCCCC
ncbi:hypothetical protein AVEN_9588-1 [Araneus ventricosus]|uniref:Uncharacterized protein n=1 Tax=Araneus ventricosus TaxID=182803 RepID=A0A4Y2H8P4_ARAVE|nr:hypothetical protein AVEN_9588-1 [Araneus ventricosus]